MIYCSCYILGAHGGPRLRLHGFPEGRCWQAGCDMKTRPAGIGNVNADWMGCLPSKLSAMPLKHLAVPGEPVVRKDVRPPLTITLGLIPRKKSYISFIICLPGSHDSFTYWVDVHAPVGPDQKPYVKYLATMFNVFAKKVMVKWSMTQVINGDQCKVKHVRIQPDTDALFCVFKISQMCFVVPILYNAFIHRISHLRSSWMQESATLISGCPPNQVSLEMKSTSSTACLATRWAAK